MIESKKLHINNRDGLIYITFPLFECFGVKHAFTTRKGGVSTGNFSTMNMGFTRGDLRENVTENYRRICSAIGIDERRLILAKQTHTNNVRTVTKADIGKGITKPLDYTDVDGLISALEGVGLVTQYADCTPLMFYDTAKKVIATSHAGWRGTALQIGKVTVERMNRDFGCRPQDIIAGIGPSIKQCCYEVDDPVFERISSIPYIDPKSVMKARPDGRHYMLDMQETNRLILMHAGIPAENIDVSDICTCCNNDMLFSHRVTGNERGNLALIISL